MDKIANRPFFDGFCMDGPIALRFLRLSDGIPHPGAFSPTVTIGSLRFHLDSTYRGPLSVQIGITIVLVLYRGDMIYGIALYWRTGNKGKTSGECLI